MGDGEGDQPADMERHAARKIIAMDRIPAGEVREKRKKGSPAPCAGYFVEERLPWRDVLAIGDEFQVTIAKQQEAGSSEESEDGEGRTASPVHFISIQRLGGS